MKIKSSKTTKCPGKLTGSDWFVISVIISCVVAVVCGYWWLNNGSQGYRLYKGLSETTSEVSKRVDECQDMATAEIGFPFGFYPKAVGNVTYNVIGNFYGPAGAMDDEGILKMLESVTPTRYHARIKKGLPGYSRIAGGECLRDVARLQTYTVDYENGLETWRQRNPWTNPVVEATVFRLPFFRKPPQPRLPAVPVEPSTPRAQSGGSKPHRIKLLPKRGGAPHS